MTGLTRTQNPNGEPISLAEVKSHLRIAHSDDDVLIANLIIAARLVCEAYTGRAMMTQGWDLWLDNFPSDAFPWWDGVREGAGNRLTIQRSVSIPRAPLQSISSVTLYGDDDTATLFSSSLYFVDTVSEPGRLALRNHASWPTAGRSNNGIRIAFMAGYGDANAVPQVLKQGMLAHLAFLYEHRGDGLTLKGDALTAKAMPNVVEALYQPFRLQRLS